ncbi:Foldase protein PrsA 1 [Dissostichus eleginoides]|uniref:Foldase protein PrsA 1 n=1 Tax=Dissostichus eleginoides TaxID=100907 RepID=A0AAD9CAP7_DISEL|nr:Foldase protein PrsA 1 [Dissostichus eleginoides]KAK1897761.1 Foldase protein PrsA 1 [Dissostichus eleginoides]KAK1897764.1 Foldase protein PrsA 1 [Dissostichus eleginoides]KAK1898139.1 Foldase protein PrsA 1 [Dissostichus eleginoides]KAK1898915.1 Foldase protein PrsA 1 [Dissostichus eleginoides]
MADRMRQRALLTTSEALALLFDSSGSGNELDTNLEKDSEKDLDDSRCEKEGNDIDTGQQIEEETADEASRADSDPDSWSESEHDDSVLDEDYRPKIDVNYLCVRLFSVQPLAAPPEPSDHG